MPQVRLPKIVYILEVPDSTTHAELDALAQELLGQWRTTLVNQSGATVVSWEWKILSSLGRTNSGSG